VIFTETVIADALTHGCEICKAPKGERCVNTITGKPMPDRPIHLYRIQPK
jgi:hypothetical protein